MFIKTKQTSKNTLIIIYICIIAFIFRFMSIFFIGDLKKEYYGEYGELAKNLLHGKGYSLIYVVNKEMNCYDCPADDPRFPFSYMINKNLDFHYKDNNQPFISAYMPPLYAFFLMPFMTIKNIIIRNILIKITHCIIAILAILLLYILCGNIFSKPTGLIAAGIACCLPEFIYSISSFSPTVLFHFLILLFFLTFIVYKSARSGFLTGIVLSLLIYLRSEFLGFTFFVILICLFSKQWKKATHFLIIVTCAVLPWTLRNYLVFQKVIPTTTNLGLNLFRGNNHDGTGAFGNASIYAQIEALPLDNKFEVAMDSIYKKEAVNFILKYPLKTVQNSIVKLFHLWFFYPGDTRILTPFYLIPAFFILITFITGIIASFSINKLKYLYLFFIYSSLMSMVFFSLPRHQTMLKICLIPFSAYALECIFKKIQAFVYRKTS